MFKMSNHQEDANQHIITSPQREQLLPKKKKKRLKIASAAEDAEKRESLYTVGGNVN